MMPFVDWSLLARLVRISRGLVPDTRGESITHSGSDQTQCLIVAWASSKYFHLWPDLKVVRCEPVVQAVINLT